jgi:hypothetical protein
MNVISIRGTIEQSIYIKKTDGSAEGFDVTFDVGDKDGLDDA